MELKTASAVINYISGFETGSADFYAACAGEHIALAGMFNSLAKQNRKFAGRIKKSYYSSVTDALETNFSFEGLRGGVVVPAADAGASAPELVKSCLQLEDDIQAFYGQAADLSKGLLTDVVRVMKRVAKARDNRKSELNLTLSNLSA